MNTTNQKPLELWGGVECTINRVGDRYFSQLARNGHRTRLDDLDRFAELGLRALRFPILWEELADDPLGETNWRQIDAQLERMRELGLRPIAGLVHHGSGPRDTSLIDPKFPEKLAAFAQRVAERYPWIDAYTPVNEPLTTARFSGLYGLWYPHGRDGFTFVRALFNQLRGVILSMREIRAINPDAALVQTDDLGKTFSSPNLQYQADFENERRWLSWDLLSGRVGREHPMWSYLAWLGAEEREIEFFRENACPADVVGVNHYITSERFLDENLRDHPPETYGGNGRHRYADVAAVRVRLEGIAGPETLLREACERYDTAVAITEAHLGCTREEQLRWLAEIWHAASTLRVEGRKISAVTAWSLLGAFDWNTLLTQDHGSYEPGAFDLRDGTPRPTAVAKMIRSLARTGTFEHPALQTPGWWQRSIRLLPSVAARSREGCPPNESHLRVVGDDQPITSARPLLIAQATGPIADALIGAAEVRGLKHIVMRDGEIESVIASSQPYGIIDCGECALPTEDIPVLAFSGPSDRGRLVVRPGKLLAPFSEADPIRELLRNIAMGEEIRVANDRRIAVSFVPDLVNAAFDLFIDGETGEWPLVNHGVTTEENLLRMLVEILGLDLRLVKGVPGWTLGQAPGEEPLADKYPKLLPSLDDALQRYCRDLPPLIEELEPAVGSR